MGGPGKGVPQRVPLRTPSLIENRPEISFGGGSEMRPGDGPSSGVYQSKNSIARTPGSVDVGDVLNPIRS